MTLLLLTNTTMEFYECVKIIFWSSLKQNIFLYFGFKVDYTYY